MLPCESFSVVGVCPAESVDLVFTDAERRRTSRKANGGFEAGFVTHRSLEGIGNRTCSTGVTSEKRARLGDTMIVEPLVELQDEFLRSTCFSQIPVGLDVATPNIETELQLTLNAPSEKSRFSGLICDAEFVQDIRIVVGKVEYDPVSAGDSFSSLLLYLLDTGIVPRRICAVQLEPNSVTITMECSKELARLAELFEGHTDEQNASNRNIHSRRHLTSVPGANAEPK